MNIKMDLMGLADQKYKEFHSNLCPGTENILGVRVPILRNYAKELIKQYSLDYLLHTIEDENYEEIMLQGMLIGLSKNLTWKELENCMKEFIPKINNWAICDVFCAGLKMTKKYKKEMFTFIKEYLQSDKEFEVRFAVVMILDYYIEKEYLEEDFQIFNNIKLDAYYVRMAVAWAISVCFIQFYDETINYMKSSTTIEDWSYNKAIQKALESYRITDKQKKELRKLKK